MSTSKRQAIAIALLLVTGIVTGLAAYRSTQLGNALVAAATVASLGWGAFNTRQ
ncbi:hypothetical protein LRE75_01495 [Streptomyces sp. 372A]|uniref:hypothetical protein n=1 Tax=Streptomyces sp. SAS_281 TaxID=3412744 RepID=UPI00403CDEEE